MNRPEEYFLSHNYGCHECRAIIIHDIFCSQFQNKEHQLHIILTEIKNSCRAGKDIIIAYDKEKIRFVNLTCWFLEGLRTKAWNNLDKIILNGKRIEIENFYIDWVDETDYADLWCLEWFFKTYGYNNVVLTGKNQFVINHQGRYTAREQILICMKEKYH